MKFTFRIIATLVLLLPLAAWVLVLTQAALPPQGPQAKPAP